MACDQNFHFVEGELDAGDVAALLALHVAEMRNDSPPEACHVLPSAALRDPAIRVVTARDAHGTLLGIGALRDLGAGQGEVKSMRTAPEACGRGVGAALLGQLIAMARAGGMDRLSLETGNSALFAPARRLYARAGFVECGPFGGYPPSPFTRFYTRTI